MGITMVKLVSQKLLIKNRLNWIKPVCAQLSEITNQFRFTKMTWSHKIIIFFHSFQN